MVNWDKNLGSLQVVTLEQWGNQIRDLINTFPSISFSHSYRENNSEVDCLSKTTLGTEEGKLFFERSFDYMTMERG